MRRKILTAWVSCGVVAAALAAETIDRTYTESFPVTAGTRLELIHGDGDVVVRPSERDLVEVEVRYHAEVRGLGGPRDFEVDFERRGDTIRVRGRMIGSGFMIGGLMRTREHRYTIRAPTWIDLGLQGDDGDVSIDDWRANVRITGGDGDVTLDGLRGTLEVRLDDGDVELLDCRVEKGAVEIEDGDVTVRGGGGTWSITLDDGDLEARDWSAGALFLRAEDGDVELGLAPGARIELEVRSDDGDVAVRLPRGASARFELSTDDGSIRLLADDAVVETRRKHRIEGVIGGGDGSIEIRTEDGDITLRDDR